MILCRAMLAVAAILFATQAPAILFSSAPPAGIPVVNAQSPISSAPAINTQAIASLSATNSPTSWAISLCSGCTGWFAIDSGGNVTVTSTGASNIAAAALGTTLAPNVTATNGAGTSSPVAINVLFYPDGLNSAPAGGSRQISTSVLTAYVTGGGVRAPWKVAGFDYPVGVQSLCSSPTDWQSYSGAHITVNAGATPPNVTLSGATGATISCVDFSLHNGAVLDINTSSNTSVINCKFGGSNYGSTTTGLINTDTSSAGLSITYSNLDGGSPSANESTLIFQRGGGTITLQYNWFHGMGQQVIEIVDNGATLNYQWNLVEGGATEVGAHLNFLQWTSGTATPTVQFNTTYWAAGLTFNAGGEPFQFYMNTSGTMASPAFIGNTLISAAGASPGYSYGVHGWSGAATTRTGTLTMQNNYLDISSAFGAFYPGSFTAPTSIANNFNMVTGAHFSDTP